VTVPATVAVVGTGRMGSAMARALRRAGFDVVVQNRTRERCVPLALEIGARVADTPADAARDADIVITMLANDDAVESTYVGDSGLLEGARPGSTLVDMSTVLPATIESIASDDRARGVGLLDAPVSGSVQLADAGTLTLMVGGDAGTLERARPALEAVGKTIFHLGPLGSGAAMKLAVNTIIFGLNGALAEGLVLAEAAGIDRAVAYDVIASSAVGAPFVGYKRASFVEPERAPVAFALDLAEKDLRLITSFADSVGASVPQAETNLAVIRDASRDGRGGADFSTVASELRSRLPAPVQASPRSKGASA
jgi:3-hydroxyisobutyrate dehydrogenase-like beta-hydroxyacid dehydrogenase